MRQQCAVSFSSDLVRLISFAAPLEIANEFRPFGRFLDEENRLLSTPNEYTLLVDPRFDFAEVLDYIQKYDEQFKNKISADVQQMLDQVDLVKTSGV